MLLKKTVAAYALDKHKSLSFRKWLILYSLNFYVYHVGARAVENQLDQLEIEFYVIKNQSGISFYNRWGYCCRKKLFGAQAVHSWILKLINSVLKSL